MKKACQLFLVFLFIIMSFQPAYAEKVKRTATIKDLSSGVKIQKSGSSRFFDAKKNMSLNQGDHIITATGSWVELVLADRGDIVTIGENAKLYIADLSSEVENRETRFKIWSGVMWVKVKELANAGDLFEVETPTAVMGVRGTHFLASVDPMTGTTGLTVVSGKVGVTVMKPLKEGLTNGVPTKHQIEQGIVFAGKEVTLKSRMDVVREQIKVINFGQLAERSDRIIIEEIIKNARDIMEENKRALESADSGLDEQLVSNIINEIAKAALQEGKITQELIDQLAAEQEIVIETDTSDGTSDGSSDGTSDGISDSTDPTDSELTDTIDSTTTELTDTTTGTVDTTTGTPDSTTTETTNTTTDTIDTTTETIDTTMDTIGLP